jgi:hypothetical protein
MTSIGIRLMTSGAAGPTTLGMKRRQIKNPDFALKLKIYA